MMPGPVSQRIVLDRLEWVRRMTDEIATLPPAKTPPRQRPRRMCMSTTPCRWANERGGKVS